jgi:hypothetical protein
VSNLDYRTYSAEETPRPLTDRERNLLHRMFSDWMEVPSEFKQALKYWLESDPPILGRSTLGGASILAFNGLPKGGLPYQPLVKSGSKNYVAAWDGRLSMPPDGNPGDLVFGGDAWIWRSAVATLSFHNNVSVVGNLTVGGTISGAGVGLLPPGGAVGNPLVKTSAADYAVGWGGTVNATTFNASTYLYVGGNQFSAFGAVIQANCQLNATGGLYSVNTPMYCGTQIYIGYNAGADATIRRYAANFIGVPGLMVEGPGYFQALVASYHNQGVSVYDSGNAAWVTMTGYGAGIRSSGHVYTAAGGYSLVSSIYTYNRHDAGGVLAGVNDDVYWKRTTEVPTSGPAWRTDADVMMMRDAGAVGWIGILVFANNIGLRRLQLGGQNSGGTGYRAVVANN